MQAFYRDADRDGHEDRNSPVMACTQPADTAPNSDDCDDASDQRFPGNAEVCDGVDNDCSAITNDPCPAGCALVRRPPPDLAGEGQWRWAGGDPFWTGGPGGQPVGGHYASWRPGEPNDDGTEDCAEMKPEGGWNDDSCGSGQKFICRR
jgi:hypothetical protein